MKTLPLVLQIDGFGQGVNKNINKVWLKVYRSSGILVGPNSEDLRVRLNAHMWLANGELSGDRKAYPLTSVQAHTF